ncbi:hypothetical protein [Mycobacteroides abscessus]|uniref:hypothetical protein n=1 Tax=Mycobacteroides abscessus TaxID=36809 RepID=UPI000944159C|nr:hypothetical protein [Mycobacteroides abscessus]SLI47288.1 Putative DNA-binding protein [Mycobacteroides abscessus subsp. abscessus]
MTDDGVWAQEMATRVGKALRDLRGRRSAQWLSDATAALGHRVTRTLITDLEIGRRKGILVHELAVLAAALGVTPAVLLTWGSVPDGTVDYLPGRPLDPVHMTAWWGGEQVPRFSPAASGLPDYEDVPDERLRLMRERHHLRLTLIGETQVGGRAPSDAGYVQSLRDRLAGIEARLAELAQEPGGSGADG